MFGYHRQRAFVEAALASKAGTRPCLTTVVARASLHHDRRRYHSSCCPHSNNLLATRTERHGIIKAIGQCNLATNILPARGRSPKSNLCLMHQSQSGVNLQSYRYLSSDSSKNKSADKQSNVISSTEESSSKPASSLDSKISSSSQIIAASTNQRKKRRRKSSSQYHSPLSQITGNHPKSKSYSQSNTTKKLTRKQILRLTPKQRHNLHSQRYAEYKNSRGYLQTARTNVRSNISYMQDNIQQLRVTADTNLKRNVDTIQRIFKGEDVWKEENEKGYDRSKDIDWEKAPEEIKANLQSNLAMTQNWLHKVTEGMIPSSSYVGIHGSSSSATTEGGGTVAQSASAAGSIATRVQQFHELKQNAPMVMDKLWITKNILFALMPGSLLGAYLFYTEGEMKEYYKKLEQLEREKVLGVGKGGGNASSGSDGGKDGGGGGGMSISSAFVTEGGTAWDRLKLTVNDLVFGGAQARIDEHKQLQKKAEEAEKGDGTVSKQTAESSSTESSSKTYRDNGHSGETKIRTLEMNNNEDPTIQMLLDRIQALEKQQLGTNIRGRRSDDDALSEEEQHQLNYANTRAKQSPIQNRRDDHLQKTWAKQEGEKEEKSVTVAAERVDKKETAKDNANSSPYTVGNVIDFATYMLEPYVESVKESAMEMMEEIKDAMLGFPEKKEESSTSNEQDANMASQAVDATKSEDSSIRSDDSAEISSSRKEDDAEESNPRAKTVVAESIDSKSAKEVTDATKSINIEKLDVVEPGRIKKWAGIVWQRVRHPFGGQGNGKDARNETDKE